VSYLQEWSQATERTIRLGLTAPNHQVNQNVQLLTENRLKEFGSIVANSLGELSPDDLVAQCISIHFQLLHAIEDWLQCPVIYTIGWIDDGSDKGMFKFDETFIIDKLKNGCTSGTVSIHAWLTLPSLEVIDVTLATSISRINNITEGYGGVIAQRADLLKGMAYKPMLVGIDFLKKSGLLIEL